MNSIEDSQDERRNSGTHSDNEPLSILHLSDVNNVPGNRQQSGGELPIQRSRKQAAKRRRTPHTTFQETGSKAEANSYYGRILVSARVLRLGSMKDLKEPGRVEGMAMEEPPQKG